jgi:hypothetical protein
MCPLGRLNHVNECYAALEMSTKFGMRIAVLSRRAGSNAIGEDRFEAVVVGSHHVQLPISDESRKMLTDALAHDSCFSVMDGKSFFHQDNRRVSGESLHAPLELGIA